MGGSRFQGKVTSQNQNNTFFLKEAHIRRGFASLEVHIPPQSSNTWGIIKSVNLLYVTTNKMKMFKPVGSCTKHSNTQITVTLIRNIT